MDSPVFLQSSASSQLQFLSRLRFLSALKAESEQKLQQAQRFLQEAEQLLNDLSVRSFLLLLSLLLSQSIRLFLKDLPLSFAVPTVTLTNSSRLHRLSRNEPDSLISPRRRNPLRLPRLGAILSVYILRSNSHAPSELMIRLSSPSFQSGIAFSVARCDSSSRISLFQTALRDELRSSSSSSDQTLILTIPPALQVEVF